MNKTEALLEILAAFYDIIKLHGKQGIPSGELYAKVMDKVDIDGYNAIIDALVRTGKITNKSHLLKAI